MRLLTFERISDPHRCQQYLVGPVKERVGIDIGGFDVSDYDLHFLRIPYRPDWNAGRVVDLVHQRVSISHCCNGCRCSLVRAGQFLKLYVIFPMSSETCFSFLP